MKMKCLLILFVVVHLGNCADEVINYEGDYNYDEEVPNKRYKKVDNFSLWKGQIISNAIEDTIICFRDCLTRAVVERVIHMYIYYQC